MHPPGQRLPWLWKFSSLNYLRVHTYRAGDYQHARAKESE